MYSASQRRQRSPSPISNNNGTPGFYNNNRRSRIQGGISPYRESSAGRSPLQDAPIKRNTPGAEEAVVVKKPKRVVDESELSEGEILTDDDD